MVDLAKKIGRRAIECRYEGTDFSLPWKLQMWDDNQKAVVAEWLKSSCIDYNPDRFRFMYVSDPWYIECFIIISTPSICFCPTVEIETIFNFAFQKIVEQLLLIWKVLDKGFENSEKKLINHIMDNLKYISDKPYGLQTVNKKKSPRIRKGNKREKVVPYCDKKGDYNGSSSNALLLNPEELAWNNTMRPSGLAKSGPIKMFHVHHPKKPHKVKNLDLRYLSHSKV